MPSNDITTFSHLLNQSGYRVTQARTTTFQLLISPHPQSIRQILDKAQHKNIDRVSVYRSIELFEKLGIVHRIYTGWKYTLELSDQFIAHHHHLSCLGCGKIIDINDEQHIDEFIASLAAEFSFTPRRHIFEVDGYCQNCTP